jgi:hypothetical protein
MRRFSSVSPRFWLARSVTGCAIRHAGPHATLVGPVESLNASAPDPRRSEACPAQSTR